MGARRVPAGRPRARREAAKIGAGRPIVAVLACSRMLARGSRSFGRAMAVLLVLPAAFLACSAVRSSSEDHNIVHSVPEEGSPDEWLEGEPRFTVVFDRVVTTFGNAELRQDEEPDHRRHACKAAPAP